MLRLERGECVCQSVGLAYSHLITNLKATALSPKFSWSIASMPKFLEAAYFSTGYLEPTSTLSLRQLPEKELFENLFGDDTRLLFTQAASCPENITSHRN